VNSNENLDMEKANNIRAEFHKIIKMSNLNHKEMIAAVGGLSHDFIICLSNSMGLTFFEALDKFNQIMEGFHEAFLEEGGKIVSH
jgi:hypothetical protein